MTPAIAPLAAKAAADKAIGDLAGISPLPNGLPPTFGIGGGDVSQNSWKTKVARFLAEKAIPDWFEDELRERHRYVGYLDPDIASKRSWSMAVKIATQRERNIERGRREVIEGPKRSMRSREFEEKWGVWI